MVNQNLSKADTTFGGESFISRITSFRHSSRINLIVQLLDETDQISIEVKQITTGQAVLDMVCEQLNIAEREFFGLRFQDNNKFRFWLDLTKPLNKQLKGDYIFLSLRFRFYPINPFLLKEDITRYQLFVQLRRDLLHGRLYCSQNDAIHLAGLILQAVLGDYNEILHPTGYVSEYKLIIKQTERLEEKISDYHKGLRGLSSLEAESQFLTLATKIETYGFDPYVVKDNKQSQDLVIGSTCRGVLVFSKNQLLKHIPWRNLSKIDYTGKELRIFPTKDYIEFEHIPTSSGHILDFSSSTIMSNGSATLSSKSPKKLQFKFICPNSTFAKHLWRHLLSQQAFFTEDEARLVKPKFSKPRIPLFSRGSTFRCQTRKVLHEIEHNPLPPRENQPIDYQRYPLPKQISRSEVSVSSRSGTIKSVRSSKIGSCATKLDEDCLIPQTESEIFALARQSSCETLTSPKQPAASTPITNAKSIDFKFTPTQADCAFDSTIDTQISTTSIQTTSDEDLPVRSKISNNDDQHFYDMEEKRIERVLQEDYDEEFPPLPTPPSLETSYETIPTTNGHANGSTVKERKSRPAKKDVNEDTVTKRIIRSILSIVMFLIIFGTFAIIVFEANNGKGVKWTRDIQPISSFRQLVYDPSKDALQQILGRFHHKST